MHCSYFFIALTHRHTGPCFNMKTIFLSMVFPRIKIRRLWDCAIFIMGILILAKWHLGPVLQLQRSNIGHNISHKWHPTNHLTMWVMNCLPDSKVHGANMGPIRDRQDPGGPHVGHMNLAIGAVQHMNIVDEVHSVIRGLACTICSIWLSNLIAIICWISMYIFSQSQ